MLASAAADVEGESACGVASGFRVGKRGEQFSYIAENTRVGCGIGARRFAYGALVYADDLVHVFNALDAVAVALSDVGAHKRIGERGEKHFVDERGFAAARHAGNTVEYAERNLDVNVFEVVLLCALYLDKLAV